MLNSGFWTGLDRILLVGSPGFGPGTSCTPTKRSVREAIDRLNPEEKHSYRIIYTASPAVPPWPVSD